MSALPLPAPASVSPSRYEQVKQYVYKVIGQDLAGKNGFQRIQVGLYGGVRDMVSSSFQSRDKTLDYSLSSTEQIALMADVRHELTSSGWEVTSCRMYEGGGRLELIVGPAGAGSQILGPQDLWPHLKSQQQLLDMAEKDLIRTVSHGLISAGLKSGGGFTVDFKVDLPATCQNLNGEQLENILAAARNVIATKWRVDKFEMEGATAVYCSLGWL